MSDARKMDTVNFQSMPYGNGEIQLVQNPIQEDGLEGGLNSQHVNGFNDGVEESGVGSGLSVTNGCAVQSRTSELTISFEGEVYVFPAVTPEKVFFIFWWSILLNWLFALDAQNPEN